MKKCERCGASNAERARFCSNCAEPFGDVVDSTFVSPTSPAPESRSDAQPAPLPATFAAVASSDAGRLESRDDFYRALATIFIALGRVFAFLFVCAFALLKRCVGALWRSSETSRSRLLAGALQLGRDAARSFAAIFTPSTRWSESSPPNFLLPSLVLFFLWTRPCALVAVVYSILSSEARHSDAPNVARRRAASARAWLLLELLCVAFKAAFEAFGMSLPILKRLFF